MIEIKRLPDGQSFDVEALTVGTLPETPVPHRHEYFEIFWVLEGTGRQSIDFIEYDMNPGQIFFITPGQVHDVHTLPDNIYAISFNAEFIDSEAKSQLPIDRLFLQNRCERPYVFTDAQGSKELRSLIDIISRELQSTSKDKDLMSILLVSFLRYVMRYLDEEDCFHRASTDMRMVKLLKLIDSNFRERKDTGFYSDNLAMTSKRLNELSKTQFSRTVTELIHEKTIVEARRKLAFTDETIKRISLNLGYKDTSYFCRFFKRVSEQSPQSFRDTWKAS